MPTLLYIYDALCGWCYGFSPVMQQLHEAYKGSISFDVLSGGMVPPEHAQPIKAKAAYIAGAYKTVEEHTGVIFGDAYLQHIFHPDESSWLEESLTPAVALCLLKAAQPMDTINFAADIQTLHHRDGKDLSEPETYRQLAASAGCDYVDFSSKLQSEEWTEAAQYEIALVKQLGITGFPAVVVQASADKFYLIARGYTHYDELSVRLEKVLSEIKNT